MCKILFVGKRDNCFSESASRLTQELFTDVTVVMSDRSGAIPNECYEWQGDYLFSFLSQWIIPQEILDNVSIFGINWHPGSNDYPGIGCTNFAIYEKAKEFGITCHHMLDKVDTGKIIEVRSFPILKDETVLSLTLKSYNEMFSSYVNILNLIKDEKDLPKSPLHWKRKPFTRKQLNELCRLSLDFDEDEVELRIKSTKYDRHWSYYEINGKKYFHE